MAKTNKQINKEVGVNDIDGSPAVVAYRVGQLEDTVRLGFKEHNDKLDKLVDNFATKSDTHDLDRRVTALESNQTWVVRAVIMQVILVLFTVIGGALLLKK